MGGEGKNSVSNLAHGIGNQHFFAQSDDERENSSSDSLSCMQPMEQLPGDVVITDNGACDQLRKKRNIEPCIQWIGLHRRILSVDINDIGNGLKSKKRDPDGQMYLANGNRRKAHKID